MIHQIQHIIAPLLDTENDRTNGFDVEEPDKKKNNKKNKKVVNGDVDKKPESNNNNREVDKSQEESKNECKKRKKKNNNNSNDKNEKAKLSKSGSVCSSLSDMSRGSGRQEKAKATIDMPYLERQLNELHRMIEKFDKVSFLFLDLLLGIHWQI